MRSREVIAVRIRGLTEKPNPAIAPEINARSLIRIVAWVSS